MSNIQRRRFIAGATCPSCKSLDSIMLYFEHGVEKIRCVQCDYQESQTDKNVSQAKRPEENVIGVFKPE